LVNHTNRCLVLELSKINKVYLLEASKSLAGLDNIPIDESLSISEKFFKRTMAKQVELVTNYEQYQIQFETKPNFAVYETTISVERNFKNFDDFRVSIDASLISRLNKYGNQSVCIHGAFPDLRKYCFCK
jgi:hypothetical protein